MAEKVCRDFDLGRTGHSCTSVIGVKALAKTVFVNGRPIARHRDPARPHTIRKGRRCVRHSARVNRASTTVFAEGLGIARVRDSYDRGRMIQGSPNVLADDMSQGSA